MRERATYPSESFSQHFQTDREVEASDDQDRIRRLGERILASKRKASWLRVNRKRNTRDSKIKDFQCGMRHTPDHTVVMITPATCNHLIKL